MEDRPGIAGINGRAVPKRVVPQQLGSEYCCIIIYFDKIACEEQVDFFLLGIRTFFLLLLLVLFYFFLKLAGTITAGGRFGLILTGSSGNIIPVGNEATHNPQLTGGL